MQPGTTKIRMRKSLVHIGDIGRVRHGDAKVVFSFNAFQRIPAISGQSITRERGKVLESELAPRVVTTVHPSSLLRQPDEEARAREYALFVKDLGVALRAVR